jgi:hypothetical protein
MYTEQIDTIEVALSILSRLEMEYKYASSKAVDKPEMIKFLAEQLDRLAVSDIMGWSEALNNISDLGNRHPPAIPEIIQEMRKVGIATRPQPKQLEVREIPFDDMWKTFSEERRLEDVEGWLKYCPLPMPDIMLQWTLDQEESVKEKLRNIKRRTISNILKKA